MNCDLPFLAGVLAGVLLVFGVRLFWFLWGKDER
jgi:hypothetical protein